MYGNDVLDIERKVARGLVGEDRWKAIVVGALRERDEVVDELRKSMSAVNMLRGMVDAEESCFKKLTMEQSDELAVLRNTKTHLDDQINDLGKTLAKYEASNAKMQNHIEGLCKEVEGLQKKLSAAEGNVLVLTDDLRKTERLLDECKEKNKMLEDEVVSLNLTLTGRTSELEMRIKDTRDLQEELNKVANFQRLMAQKSSARRSTKKPHHSDAKSHPLPPEEATAVHYLSIVNPAVKYALQRTPASPPDRAAKASTQDDPETSAMEKFKWATPSLNNTAKSSILSKYYLNKA
eukprot:TRINITY_DN8712_c0_g1_i1.p1 TRINITY_DN8712_c0_g1~~TRINITY_DN8712_c0_g1_i1.p1  ORF type:complete len:313 (+),score=108.06 TRINITY_DN8712_c0_g1_i1:62-940(+)